MRNKRFSTLLPCALCLLPFLASPSYGQSGWVGRKFMPKEACIIKIGNREIAAQTVPLPYVVQQVSGDWLWIGDGWVQKSRVAPLDQAAAYYNDYLRSHPNSACAYNLRGWTAYENGDFDSALNDYSAAIRLDPNDAVAYNNRGGVRQRKGDYGDALKDYNQAIRLDPREPMGYNSLAWLLATCSSDQHRDGPRAVSMARRACELTAWKDAYSIDTLAAAYAESDTLITAETLIRQWKPLWITSHCSWPPRHKLWLQWTSTSCRSTTPRLPIIAIAA